MLLVYRHLVKVKNHCFDYFNEMKSSFIYNLQWSLHGIPIFLTWTPCWVYEFGANVNHTWAKVWIQTRNNEHCVKTNQKMNLWMKVSYQDNSCMYIFWNTMRVLHSQIPTAWPQLDSQNWNLCIKKCAKINLLTILKSHTFTSTTKNMGVAKVKKCFNL